jgi:hypothetical protein
MLRLCNCTSETIQVTDSRMLANPGLQRAEREGEIQALELILQCVRRAIL